MTQPISVLAANGSRYEYVCRQLSCLMAERQSARMPKITNDGLTRSGTGCFIAVPIWQQWASKG